MFCCFLTRHRRHVGRVRGGEAGGETGEQRGEGERKRGGKILRYDREQEQRDEHGRAVVRLQRGARAQARQKGKVGAAGQRSVCSIRGRQRTESMSRVRVGARDRLWIDKCDQTRLPHTDQYNRPLSS